MNAAVPIPADLQLAADELLQESIMGGVPVIIVEGFDDIKLYDDFAKQAGRTCDIIASENILSEKEGCSGVIDNLDIIASVANGINISDYVLGVIDRDARFYRGELPTNPAILALQTYSIESHFVTEESAERIIRSVLQAPSGIIDQLKLNEIYSSIKQKLGRTYLASLEALKKACVRDYAAEIGYSDNIRSFFLSGALARVQAKQADLETFAGTHKISNDWANILLICKGKWLLDLFCDDLIAEIDQLTASCASGKIQKCQYCENGTHEKCLYRWKAKYSSTHLKCMIREYSDLPEFNYIRSRISNFA